MVAMEWLSADVSWVPTFAYKLANLFPGAKVLCTVLKQATEDRRMLVSIDSVPQLMPIGA